MTDLRQLAFAAVPLLLLAACSDDDGGGGESKADPEPYIEAAAASMTSDEGPGFDDATATCVSTALVEVIGADALAEADVTPEEFADANSFDDLDTDAPDPAQLSERLDGCDLATVFGTLFVEEAGLEASDETVTCVTEGVDRQALNDAMAASFVSEDTGLEDAVGDAVLDGVVGCTSVVTEIFLGESPGTARPETEACIEGIVAANAEQVRSALEGDSEAAEALGTEMAETCGSTLGA